MMAKTSNALVVDAYNKRCCDLPQSVFLVMRTDVEMLRHGTDQPTAVVHLSSIGVFDEKRNPAYAKALMEFIVAELDIPDQRLVGRMVTNKR